LSEEPPPWWAEHGYVAGRQLDAQYWVCVAEMIFTWRLMLCDPGSVHDFYCYSSKGEALEAVAIWDGYTDPPGQWIRHHATGRRRLADGSIVIAP
jgi:hypothetical protein